MASADPRAEYDRRIAASTEVVARQDRRHLAVSNLRLAFALAAVVLAWLGFGRHLIALGWTFLAAAAFFVLVVVHAVVLNARDRALRARRYFERGVSRLEGTWSGTGPDGARFLDGHPYARDLDLFGHGSLFQLITTATTETGEDTLADWLKRPAALDEIRDRQQAVAELRDRLTFRETLAVQAAEAQVSSTGALMKWASTEPVGFRPWHAALFAALAAVTAVVIGSVIAGWLNAWMTTLWLAVQGLIVLMWRKPVDAVLKRADAAAYDLDLLAALLKSIEGERFESPRLARLHAALAVGDVMPSRRLKTLHRLIAARDAVRNEFVRPFAMLLLVRHQSAVAIDRWHAAHRRDLANWLSVIGELEAFASLATYAFEHPHDPFPDCVTSEAVFTADALAHPLIPESRAVPNSVALGGAAPHVLIVSGSNMSGKSTLLRAIGVNVVLAVAGAPVRAKSLTLSPLVIGSTIRIEDSLEAGQSRFFAEILRIKGVVADAKAGKPVLFLLDEILGGTNSYDRRIGSEAVVRLLVEHHAIGAITTHDLALTDMAGRLPSARNVHFEDHLVNGAMTFDYRMRDGVVERSNALGLMRAIGIDV